jgi:large subunit ribosomal protein L2
MYCLLGSSQYGSIEVETCLQVETANQIIQKMTNKCKIRLPSGKIIDIYSKSTATIGKVSNFLHNQIILGKAGLNRLKNKRPKVRGIAMNPVDHPHGGRTNGGMPSVTPWGIPTKGKPTVKKNYG